MSETRNRDQNLEKGQSSVLDSNLAGPTSDVSSIAGSVKNIKQTTSERQIKFERAQKCLENAALVSKRIKEHRKATAELLGRPFEDDGGDTDMASAMSEKTNYSVTTNTSTTLSVQDALNIPGISESLANTLKQKELIMERIKQYKEINKRPTKKSVATVKKDFSETTDANKSFDNIDVTKLTNTIKEKENALSIMQIKIKAMETTILDLQEKINEKDQIIESKNRATTLITDSLSKKEKDTLDLLEDTKQQMSKMQSNFVTMEMEWKEEKQKLLLQIEEKDEKIKSLEEANTILENSRFEISIAHSKVSEDLDLKLKEILELQEKLKAFSESQNILETESEAEKGTLEITNMEELTKKVELLEQINYQIRQTNKDLENQLSSMGTDAKLPVGKKGSPLLTRKGGRNTSSKGKSPWSQLVSESSSQETEKKTKIDKSKSEILLQSLNKDILDKEFIINQKDEVIHKLEVTVKENMDMISNLQSQISLQKKSSVDVGIMTEFVVEQPVGESFAEARDLEEKLKSALNQIEALNNEIDLANKNMIKVKSTSKLKLRQMQKSIENFSKVSDANAEIVRLNEELQQLSQKVVELEEEKGNLQLHLVDYDGGRLTESEAFKKMVEMENLAEARLKSITLLETQKFDLVQELHNLQQKESEMEDKLADMSILQNEQVCSEMKLVQLEEQIDGFNSSQKEMEIIIENLKLDIEQLNKTINILHNEKEELTQKLENYIQANIELNDKLEKLSAEKVSSAESIEIVESLTTQEKMELEEYNRSMDSMQHANQNDSKTKPTSKEDLINETEELKKKIELFTHERQEVMERMSKISIENDLLVKNIAGLKNEHEKIQITIQTLQQEKHELLSVNEELNNQIEGLKKERTEVLKETVEVTKRASIDDAVDGTLVDVSNEDKSGVEKSNRSKTVKQLTKDILKLKNTIKEREDEIADCQMKILSLEEQQEKQRELIQTNASYDVIVKRLNEENSQLKKELESIEYLKKDNERLQLEIQKIHQEYISAINVRESRINDLEKALIEYEKQAVSYVNSLQQKDKEITEYINQITKLNDISKKLKATVDLLEEEKATNQNAELVKSLTKQISLHQKSLNDYEDKIRMLEEDKLQLNTIKTLMENKNSNIELELTKLQQTLEENKTVLNEIQAVKHNQAEELSATKLQAKERDEEIHEIKLQLRKESIENEKLRTIIDQKEEGLKELKRNYDEVVNKLEGISVDKGSQNEQYAALESKNKELLEKLKKFAVNIKKKSAMNLELENQLKETQMQLDEHKEKIKELTLQANNELNEMLQKAGQENQRLRTQISELEVRNQEFLQMEADYQILRASSLSDTETISKLNEDIITIRLENNELKNNVECLSKKVVENDIDQKNNINLLTKLSCLETEASQKQKQIEEMLSKLQDQSEKLIQIQHSYDAKIQERDLYIENLQVEVDKYRDRICRLEQCISTMENSRQSLERKADQLDFQLQEKQKAYSEYACQEDELVARLAVLIDHDKVVEKQLHEIEEENKNLKNKMVYIDEELQRTQKQYSEIQEKAKIFEKKSNNLDVAESEIMEYQKKLREAEFNLKQITNEKQILEIQKKSELEEIEAEFNTQIENSIKDKKNLSEKYEKLLEHSNLLESELQQYKHSLQNVTANLEELTCENRKLVQNAAATAAQNVAVPKDHTEQYICEINNLTSHLNNKNEVIKDLNVKIQMLHNDNLTNASNMNSKILELNEKLQSASLNLKSLEKETDSLRQNNEHLQTNLMLKEDQIRQLRETKKLVFEMNIPKTEGLTISSTIEPINEDQNVFNTFEIDSQILDESEIRNLTLDPVVKRNINELQKSPIQYSSANEEIQEPELVQKKTYMCYKEDKEKEECDPFNSEEGWGLETNEYTEEITPGLSHLNKQIQVLSDANEALKKDLEVSNTKLMKAMKRLKELKAKNEMLSNELKISKQLSDSSFLDVAIENELSSNLQLLEKKVEELNVDLSKEKKEKDALRKQNEVLQNGNDRLIEMKEKMDSEIELWKYNLKQANDKLSSLQWDSERKNSDSAVTRQTSSIKPIELSNEIIKIEKENDELQILVENLNAQNKALCDKEKQLEMEVKSLTQQLQQSMSHECEMCQSVKDQLVALKTLTEDLEKKNINFIEKIKNMESQIRKLSSENEFLKNKYEEDLRIGAINLKQQVDKNTELVTQIENLKSLDLEATLKISQLNSELEAVKLENLNRKEKTYAINVSLENYALLEESCSGLESSLNDANNKLHSLERHNEELLEKCNGYEVKILKLNSEVENLNKENDQLLSTVAELRSSISSAMDQRGFEIAELWKQHLAQRESEFQKIEHDLRSQVNTFQEKYEQLLENMQSSTQEETNKLIVVEQVTSLQCKLKEKEEHLLSLQDKYAEAINQLDLLRSEMEDERTLHENKILVCQEENEKSMNELSLNYQQQIVVYEEKIRELRVELETSEVLNSTLKLQMEELKIVYETKIQDLSKQIQMKESEMFQKTHDLSVSLSHRNKEFELVRKQLVDYEKKVEDLTFEKESELAILRLKIHEITDNFNKIQKDLDDEKSRIADALNEKILECTNLNKIISDLNKSLEEHSSKATETQMVLESQELEIVTLKDEVTNLKEMLSTASSKIERHVTFASDTKPGQDVRESGTLNRELLDAVPKAELDLALYMLHQRDVRCEELTMELTQLLEERDTLQLRLSDSLRSYEELKLQVVATNLDVASDVNTESVSDLPGISAIEKHGIGGQFVETHRSQTSRSSSISDPDGKPSLQAKLSELRGVKHSRDVRLRQDSEQRQLGMRLLQRDVANLPPEALDQLTQAQHTLSRDTQSTPTVLLNWLRGKSTPKVVHM